ncbi:SLAC1 anion channel family protein [Spiribacter onubensis]|uniref:SLAC1 anion channel family protein n=1 Tax=Spiribacter onubensis TaxID=3122420 RepID=A0ABV3S6A1_9GAMM
MSDQTRLQNLPIAFFAMVMGLSGLTLVWQKAGEVLGTPVVIGRGLVFVVSALFALLLIAYLLKAVRHPAAVRAELDHPVKLSFFPTISISLILIGTALRHLMPMLSLWLWALGTALQLVLTIFIINRWMHEGHFQVVHMNPAWFIPAVGNILVPIAGVAHGYPSISWFFFSIGVVFWVILLTIVFYRVIFHDPLPGRLLPTLFILIAPPAAGFIAYMALVGELDTFGRIMVNIALFLTILLVTQARRFAALDFALSFWAYSFPLAAMTVALMIYHELTGTPWTLWLGGFMAAATTALIGWLVVLTGRAASRGQICVAEG